MRGRGEGYGEGDRGMEKEGGGRREREVRREEGKEEWCVAWQEEL